jgi:hypothetical protein
MQKITPYGNMTCDAGYEMDYQGMRYETEKFIYRALGCLKMMFWADFFYP